ncbi:uncharacterized protein LOC121045577 [Ixodes scapularis]|uniref:uncharacterized protein LOC121045577 n=1 Tax=Ixodes scapularis TaxID=6945 RepID=UPI001AD666F6|nr:uncharacterized protein LOC121045577 [Ixodes scapularis]
MATEKSGSCLTRVGISGLRWLFLAAVLLYLVGHSSEKKLLKLALAAGLAGGTTFIPIPLPLRKDVYTPKLVPIAQMYPVPYPVYTHEHVHHDSKHEHINHGTKHEHEPKSKVVVLKGDHGGHGGGYGGYDGDDYR